MKFVFVAPEISSPYTEGRKRFVRDLITALNDEHRLFLLTTQKPGAYTQVDADFASQEIGHSALHLLYLIQRLPKIIREQKPDLICLFPYGTFRHIYGLVNKAFIGIINRICRHYGIPCLTIMYSMDEYIHLEQLNRYADHVAVTNHHSDAEWVIDIGLPCFPEDQLQPDKKGAMNTRNILFMAGMWETTIQRVEHVIDTRGLEHLLKIGHILAEQGIRLIIAAPLFSSSECQEYLLAHPLNSWPEGSIRFYDEVKVPDIFDQCDIFAFPYQKHIKQFTPTSVLESMCAGRCVAISDIPLFQSLAADGKNAFILPLENSQEMAKVLIEAIESPQKRKQKELTAKAFIDDNWSIKRSVAELIQIAEQLLKK